MNKLIMPKEKRLFAPMLATFGGGSVSGFRSGVVEGPPPSIVTNNLVFHLDAGDPASNPNGTSWIDISGGGNQTTLYNLTYSPDNSGYFYFNGTNSYVQTNFRRDNYNFSYSAWFRPTNATSGQQDIMDTFEDTSSEWARLSINSDAGYPSGVFTIDNNSNKVDLPTATSLSSFNWYNLTGTWNSSTRVMRVYLNGVLSNSATHPEGPPVSGLSDMRIGAFAGSSSSEYYEGDIADIKAYSGTLSDAEVLQNFNALKGRFGL